jgi:hypothetical protein
MLDAAGGGLLAPAAAGACIQADIGRIAAIAMGSVPPAFGMDQRLPDLFGRRGDGQLVPGDEAGVR